MFSRVYCAAKFCLDVKIIDGHSPGLQGFQSSQKQMTLMMGIISFLALLGCPLTSAQWVSQTITLEPGWNAVYLEVEPQPSSCDTVFEGIPIESVWYWAPDTSPIQFITNPDRLEPEDPDWRVYFPATSLANTLTTLRVVRGNRPYIIKMSGDATVEWVIHGMSSLRPIKWIPDSFNLAGFPVEAGNAPSFETLFAASDAHAGQSIMRMNSSGNWETVSNPASVSPDRGEAFWVYTMGVSEYQGVIPIVSAMKDGLTFGRGITELSLEIHNQTAAEKTYTLTPRDSETPADPASPALAGSVPLAYWKDDYASQDVGWRPLTGSVSVAVGAGDYRPVKFAVLRNQMVPPAEKVDGESLYQSVLEISDGQGSWREIPVTARGLQDGSSAKADAHPAAGLWIGSVTLNAVSEPAGVDTTSPQPTGSEFSFQVIVHVDTAGTAKLLQHVTQMWKEPIYEDNPVDPQNPVVLEPGGYVLITDDAQLAEFRGSNQRGGVDVGRRFSCPAFGFREPIIMSGSYPTPSQPVSSITCDVVLDYDDPLNPFKHRYHPDHDNMDTRYENMLQEGKESFTVTRNITLEFIDYSASSEGEENNDLLLSAYAGWGDSWLGGTYKEAITGIHRDTLYVEGSFQLNFVSDTTELNPEN